MKPCTWAIRSTRFRLRWYMPIYLQPAKADASKQHKWSMSDSLLDFSRRRELSFHAAAVADVETVAVSVGARVLIVGAFARDLHLLYRYAIATQRVTEDVDIALAVPAT